jgi:hypothetical protein
LNHVPCTPGRPISSANQRYTSFKSFSKNKPVNLLKEEDEIDTTSKRCFKNKEESKLQKKEDTQSNNSIIIDSKTRVRGGNRGRNKNTKI